MQKVRRTCLTLPVFPYFENIPCTPIADMNSRFAISCQKSARSCTKQTYVYPRWRLKAKGKGKASDDANKASDLYVVRSPEFGSRYKSAWENPPPLTTTPLMPHFDDGMGSRNINTGTTA